MGVGSPCEQGEPKGGGRQLPFFVNFGSAIGITIVAEWFHKWIHSVGSREGCWNKRLLRSVGITDFDWEECLRYNSNQAKSLLKSLKDQNRKRD